MSEAPSDAEALPFNPLDAMSIECDRLKQACALMDEVATTDQYSENAVNVLIRWMREDLTLLHRDEASDLFPLLNLRARRGDDLRDILARLVGSHAETDARSVVILRGLEAMRSLTLPAMTQPRLVEYLKEHAIHERQHLALLNAIVLPIARLRLTPADLEVLRQGMATRRAISHTR